MPGFLVVLVTGLFLYSLLHTGERMSEKEVGEGENKERGLRGTNYYICKINKLMVQHRKYSQHFLVTLTISNSFLATSNAIDTTIFTTDVLTVDKFLLVIIWATPLTPFFLPINNNLPTQQL